MQKTKLVLLAAAMSMMLGANVSIAADQAQAQQKTQDKAQKPELIYGSQLMTRQERDEYHAKMRSLKTEEEREAFRMEHHQKMQERAKAKGKTLPDMHSAQGGGAGGCGGMHGGMKHGGAGAEGGSACGGAGGCCGGCCSGCCGMHGGMKHGEAGAEGGAGCVMHGGMQGMEHEGMQHEGMGSEGGTEPQGGAAPEEHKH